MLKGIDANFTGLSTGDQTITIEKNTLDDLELASDLHGCQTGSGIRVGAFASDSAPPVTSTVSGNTVSQFQKNGITINGESNTGKLTTNTVTSDLGTQSQIAQNLIQFGFGAGGSIGGKSTKGNHLNGFGAYTGTGSDSSAGILLYDVAPGVKINGNTFREASGLLSATATASRAASRSCSSRIRRRSRARTSMRRRTTGASTPRPRSRAASTTTTTTRTAAS